MINLTIIGIPKPKQSTRMYRNKKTGALMTFKDDKISSYEDDLKTQVLNQIGKNFVPLTSALAVKVNYYFPPLKTFTKKLKGMIDIKPIYKTTKPDLTDNLNKPLFDALQNVLYLNDSQICQITASKQYSNRPRIELSIEEVV